MVKGFKWGIVTGVDPNVKNIVGATVLHSSEGKFGCLLRLEPNFETQVRDDDVDVGGNLSKLTMRQMYRITIRATDESVPPVLVKAMQDRLSQGIEGMA